MVPDNGESAPNNQASNNESSETGAFSGNNFGGRGVSIGGNNNDNQMYSNYDHLD